MICTNAFHAPTQDQPPPYAGPHVVVPQSWSFGSASSANSPMVGVDFGLLLWERCLHGVLVPERIMVYATCNLSIISVLAFINLNFAEGELCGDASSAIAAPRQASQGECIQL